MNDQGHNGEPPSNLLRLASDNPNPIKPACTTCLHYHPNLDYYGRTVIRRSWWPPFFRFQRVTDANSHYKAVCSFFGGHWANEARNACEGDNWEPKDD